MQAIGHPLVMREWREVQPGKGDVTMGANDVGISGAVLPYATHPKPRPRAESQVRSSHEVGRGHGKV